MRPLFRGVPTEARISLRESVRIFCLLQSSPYNFEDLCHGYSKSRPDVFQFTRLLRDATCGNFIRGFTSLFLPRNEITRGSLSELIDGSALTQYANHSNLILLGMRDSVPDKILTSFSSSSHAFTKWQSCRSHSQLSSRLMACDADEDLPRVFLLSLSWALTLKTDSLIGESSIGDHKAVMIKHSNENFQLVQNYICDGGREAMTLRDWQSSNHPYASKRGFGRGLMSQWLCHLFAFTGDEGNKGFSAKGHMELFGTHLPSLEALAYWPSFSFKEIDDDCIRGSGSRCMAVQLEQDFYHRATSTTTTVPH